MQFNAFVQPHCYPQRDAKQAKSGELYLYVCIC